MLRLAVLASGRGSNFKAILEHIQAGRIDAEIALLLCNVPDAPALAIAKEAGIKTWARSHKDFSSRAAFDAAMLEAMREEQVEAVVLAGYMRLLSAGFIEAYADRIMNIHPALLPAFPGVSGGGDAVAYGVKLAGCTVHFVTPEMDAGPIIIQAALPVEEKDTEESLMERMHKLEHRLYPQAVAWLAAGRLSVTGRKVRLKALAQSVPNAVPEQNCIIHPPLEQGF